MNIYFLYLFYGSLTVVVVVVDVVVCHRHYLSCHFHVERNTHKPSHTNTNRTKRSKCVSWANLPSAVCLSFCPFVRLRLSLSVCTSCYGCDWWHYHLCSNGKDNPPSTMAVVIPPLSFGLAKARTTPTNQPCLWCSASRGCWGRVFLYFLKSLKNWTTMRLH